MDALHAITPGTLLGGDFRVLHPLGAGGMGAVYVAEQLSTGNQRALKVMDPRLLRNNEMRDRFANEAKVGARIDSDHVVQVVAAGVDPASEIPWLAMELLQGENLSQTVQRYGPLHPAKVAEVTSQLCHALDAAHRVGIIHRDLKPENIFLAMPRREGIPFTVKILDFGIAKILQGADSGMTATLGTPLWMAPEQTSPGADVAPATDIWPLGLLVFWMLTGTVYWRSARIQPPSLPGLMREVVLDPIEPASVRAADLSMYHLFPPAMDAWFATCLNRNTSGRFPNALTCRDALLQALSVTRPTQPVISAPTPWAHPSPLANSFPGNSSNPTASSSTGAATTSPTSPTPTAAAPAPTQPQRSYLPHLSIITCGTIMLAGIGSCGGFLCFSSYQQGRSPAPTIQQQRIVGFDHDDFDPSQFLSTANELARDKEKTARLVQISVEGLETGNSMSLKKADGNRSVVYAYRSDHVPAHSCSINVIVDDTGVTTTQGRSMLCEFAPVPEPKCTVFQLRDRAIAAGAKADPSFSLTYRSQGGKPAWIVSTKGFQEIMQDDCR